MKKLIILLLILFALSCFSIVSAHDVYQHSTPGLQMLDGDNPPPPPPEDPPNHHHKRHHDKHHDQDPPPPPPEP